MLEIGLMTSGEGGVRLGKEAKGFQISPPNSFGSACSPYIFDLSKYQQTFLFSWSLRPSLLVYCWGFWEHSGSLFFFVFKFLTDSGAAFLLEIWADIKELSS